MPADGLPTAYRMLFGEARLQAGDTVLVQGASGGLTTALVLIGRSRGLRVWLTGRSEESRAYGTLLGAEQVFPHGERLPERVDAVIDAIGAATWSHSLRSLRAGGTLVAGGGVSGFSTEIDIARVVRNRIRIVGSMMGTKDDLRAVVGLCIERGVRPPIEEVIPLADVAHGLRKLLNGGVNGKIVVNIE